MNKTTHNFRLLIRDKNWITLKQNLSKVDPSCIARLIAGISSDKERIIIFRLLSREQAKQTFQRMTYSEQKAIIDGLASNSTEITLLLDDLDPDDRTAFFEELPGEVSQKLMQLLSPREREITTQLLGYPPGSIGRLMTPEYVAVRPSFVVRQAIRHIREFGSNSETLDRIYVVEDTWKLIGSVSIKDIIIAHPQTMISELTDDYLVYLCAYDDRNAAIKVFRENELNALPVVDSHGVLVGIVTADDVINLAEAKAAVEFQRFGSVSNGVINPLKARIGKLYSRRIVWLLALVFVNIFSGTAVQYYENVIQSVVSLVFYLTLLIDSSGNAGSQSATLMIRALAVGDVQVSHWARLLGKELFVSLLLGLTMAAAVSLVSTFQAPEVMPVVALTMVLTVVCGSLLGMLLPFVLTKFSVDPATASAPLITSLCDIMGVVIYLSLASWYFEI